MSETEPIFKEKVYRRIQLQVHQIREKLEFMVLILHLEKIISIIDAGLTVQRTRKMWKVESGPENRELKKLPCEEAPLSSVDFVVVKIFPPTFSRMMEDAGF